MTGLIPRPVKMKEYPGFCRSEENIEYTLSPGMADDGSYVLNVGAEKIRVVSGGGAGRFYADMTLKELKLLYGKYPIVSIEDTPAFGWRGFMIDCARHFFPTDELKKMIELAAMLKFNKFHWHLSDDQGFRIDSERFPELTAKASVRPGDNFGRYCRTDADVGGFYTKDDIRDIVAFCAERYIEVVPEIDMPGHTSAILHVFPELSCRKQPVDIKRRQGIYKDNLCLGDEKTKVFVRELLSELCELFPGEYFHIGGDEAPNDYRRGCRLCENALKGLGLKDFKELQCRFADETAAFLAEKGKKTVVWNDLLKGGGIDRGITVQKWMDPKNASADAANGGNPVIISDYRPYYLDYPYGMHPLKAIYKKDPAGSGRLTEAGRKNILGVEAPVWTEYIETAQRLEYMCLPRWFAVAENAWSPQENKDYRVFRRVCDGLCDRLSERGYTVAPEKDRTVSLPRQAAQTAKFFLGVLPDKDKK